MIVMIHSHFLNNFPLLRCAVPAFFMISSYFFFKKINNTQNARYIYINFIKRAIKLYLFWFITLTPYMIGLNMMAGDIISFIKLLPFNALLRSTFPASWYISAYIIGISICYKLRNHNFALLIIGIISYLMCCAETNYSNIVYNIPIIQNFCYSENNNIVSYIKEMYLSFPVGLLFCYLGKYIAEKNTIYQKANILGMIMGFIFLMFENDLIISHNWRGGGRMIVI